MTVVIQINAFFIITVKIQKTKMASDAKCALSQWKVKPIPLIFFPCYCKKQIDGSFLWSILL